MKSKSKEAPASAVRNPDRTRRRILEAAFREFSERGEAGARVDVIARRARINKRMLYHYFGDKRGLYRAMVRHKIHGRINSVAAAQSPGLDVVSNIGLWFRQNCQDADWIKHLAWESLQSTRNTVVDEAERRRLSRRAVSLVKERQVGGLIRRDLSANFLHLAKVSLTMFPMALPQMARLILGGSPHSRKFQAEYAQFLTTIAEVFRPAAPAKKPGASRRRRS
jgi:TetR/AcrR family transcriptional regulator